MAKRQDSQNNGQKTEGQPIQWPKDRRTANTMAKRKRTANTMAKRKRTANTMTKRQKDSQYNGQETGQPIQWPKDRRTANNLQNTTQKSQDRKTQFRGV
jgi:hypothetical protein